MNQRRSINSWIIAVGVFFMAGCGSTPETKAVKQVEKLSKYADLLTRFKPLQFDTLHLYSEYKEKYKYTGIALDSQSIRLLPEHIANAHFNGGMGVFAIGRVELDSNRIGLIARTPGDYEETSIKILVLNKEKDTLVNELELGETWGDAGDIVTKDAWLFRTNDKKWKTFIWVVNLHDNNVDDSNDTTVVRTDEYYLVNLTNNRFDTIATGENAHKDFKHLNPDRRD